MNAPHKHPKIKLHRDKASQHNTNNNKNRINNEEKLSQLQRECSTMIRLLKRLERDEMELRTQNEILARECLLNGFELGLLETPAPKRRKSSITPAISSLSKE